MMKMVEGLLESLRGFQKEEVKVHRSLRQEVEEVLNALQTSGQTAFTSEQVSSIFQATAHVDIPVKERQTMWPSAANRGLFIVFEGLDRSGKTTQSKLLTEKLGQAGQVQWTSFPNRQTPTGSFIDLFLKRTIDLPRPLVHKLFSANRWERAAHIVETLNSGISVVCDRYSFSGLAYAMAEGLDSETCRESEQGLPNPDLVFFMKVDEKVGSSRAGFGDERYENATLQASVRIQFQQPVVRDGVVWQDVDGTEEIQVIHEKISAAVEERKKALPQDTMPSIHGLWL